VLRLVQLAQLVAEEAVEHHTIQLMVLLVELVELV
jgi:hypothetical protein